MKFKKTLVAITVISLYSQTAAPDKGKRWVNGDHHVKGKDHPHYQVDPSTLDSDKDYLNDALEADAGLDPNNFNDAWLDNDNDGFNNGWEVTQTSDHNSAASMPSQRYPSTKTAMTIPGYQETPDASVNPNLLTAADVEQWEYDHFDLAAGINLGPQGQSIKSIGYMYNQALDVSERYNDKEAYRSALKERGLELEDAFIHFKNDTTITLQNPTHSSHTSLSGKFDFLYKTWFGVEKPILINTAYGAINQDLWTERNSGQGQANMAYAGQGFKFDQINVTLNQTITDGDLSFYYSTGTDTEGNPTWASLDLFEESTNNLAQNGSFRFIPPSDWERVTVDGDQTNKAYFVKITLSSQETLNVATFETKDLRHYNADQTEGTILGWDPANDTNNDGYVDDAEFSSRANTSASARTRTESRVWPVGNMWSHASSYSYIDVTNPLVRSAWAQVQADRFVADNLSGAYNDDFIMTINRFNVVNDGGFVTEWNTNINTDQATNTFYDGFTQLMKDIADVSGAYIAANISETKIYQDPIGYKINKAFNLFLREGYMISAMGLDGYFGFNKMWDVAVSNQANQDSLILGHVQWGRVDKIGNTKENWEKDLESVLAGYYLISDPEHTYFNGWNPTFYYGSGNTLESKWSYYKAGVPKNYAYQPHGLLSVDIGVPANSMPEGAKPLTYTAHKKPSAENQWGDSYFKIGDTTSTTLVHPEFETGTLEAKPTYTYYAWHSDTFTVAEVAPSEAVLARDFTKGKVLFYTHFNRGDAEHLQKTSPVINLGGLYHRVNFDGSLSEPISEISLQGYEAAILLKAK